MDTEPKKQTKKCKVKKAPEPEPTPKPATGPLDDTSPMPANEQPPIVEVAPVVEESQQDTEKESMMVALSADISRLTDSLKKSASEIQSVLKKEDAQIERMAHEWRPYAWILKKPGTFVAQSLAVTFFLPFMLHYAVSFVTMAAERGVYLGDIDWAVRWYANESDLANYYYWSVVGSVGFFSFLLCLAAPAVLLIEDMCDNLGELSGHSITVSRHRSLCKLHRYCKRLRVFAFAYVMCYGLALAAQLLFNLKHFAMLAHGPAYIALTGLVSIILGAGCKRLFCAAFNEHVMAFENSPPEVAFTKFQ